MTAGVDPAVLPEWLVALPVVVLGAPAGALVATRVRREVVLAAIAALTLVQFAWTVVQVRPGLPGWAGMAAIAVAVTLSLERLAMNRQVGAGRSRHRPARRRGSRRV